MANFLPLKNYILYCLEHLISEHFIQGPFLDVGCGIGDVSRHLARRGWKGKAIDISDTAIAAARITLREFSNVTVNKQSLSDESGLYGAIFFMDILEHVDNDLLLLAQAASRLKEDGHIIISVPSNPREWRWDDDFYGHVRRYTVDELEKKLSQSGLQLITAWDFTFPFFWALRRAYTALIKQPKAACESAHERTLASSTRNAWQLPFVASLLSKGGFLWQGLYHVQFRNFRSRPDRGHEMIVLASKRR